MHWRAVTLFALSLLSLRCGGGESAPAGGEGAAGGGGAVVPLTSTAVPEAELAVTYARALCGFYERCCVGDLSYPRDECEQHVVSKLTETVIEPMQAASAPFEPSKAGLCVAVIERLGCAFSEWPALAPHIALLGDRATLTAPEASVCGAYGRGALREGERCVVAEQCEGREGHLVTCIARPSSPAVCEYQRLSAVGEACDGQTCAPGLMCNLGACSLPVQEGQPCEHTIEGCAVVEPGTFTCLDTGTVCAEGLSCEVATAKCHRRPQLGDPCAVHEGCRGGAVCLPGAGSREPVGVCSPRAPVGGACAQASHCQPGLRCVGALQVAGTCAPLARDGETCATDADCVSMDCARATSTCKPTTPAFCYLVGARRW